MKKLLFDCGTRDITGSIGILALRVMIGLMMLIGHGIPKIQKFGVMKDKFFVPDFFPFQYMSSQVSLMACITAEVGAAILITLGLATRPAAFVLGFTMVVAAFATNAANPWFFDPNAAGSKELAILYIIPMIVLIFSGGGRASMDSMFYKERRGGRLKVSI